MSVFLGARRLTDLVRKHIQDEGNQAWSDTEILEAIDHAIEDMTETRRLVGEDDELDRLEKVPGDFTLVEGGNEFWAEIELPETVHAVRKVEGTKDGIQSPFPILEGMLEDKDKRYSSFHRGIPIYTFTRHGRPGNLSIFGAQITQYQLIRIWFIRRHPSLHFGTAATGGSTTTVVFDNVAATLNGRVVKRDDLYTGMDIEFDAGSALEDQKTRITGFVGSTRIATVFPALTAVTDDEPYSLIVPFNPEFMNLVIQKSAMQLFMRAGNTEYLAAVAPSMNFLEERFRSAISTRSNDAPKKVWSSRR